MFLSFTPIPPCNSSEIYCPHTSSPLYFISFVFSNTLCLVNAAHIYMSVVSSTGVCSTYLDHIPEENGYLSSSIYHLSITPRLRVRVCDSFPIPYCNIDLVQTITATKGSWGQWSYHIQKTLFHFAPCQPLAFPIFLSPLWDEEYSAISVASISYPFFQRPGFSLYHIFICRIIIVQPQYPNAPSCSML